MNYLKEFKEMIDVGGSLAEADEIYKDYKRLVGYNTPKRVIMKTEEIGDRQAFGGTGYEQYGVAICPSCDNYLDVSGTDEFGYCPWCGQALKWPEDECEACKL